MAARIAIIVLLLACSLGATHGAEANGRTQLLIYYGNETSRQAVQSANYATLFEVLRTSPSATAATLARNIQLDSTEFPAAVRRDADALLAAARRLKFDLVVFTNDLALDGHYWSYRSATDALEVRTLPRAPEAANTVLATSPLSRPEFLATAMQETGSLYPANSVDAVLIVNSHGGPEMILMPRVNTDLSVAGAAKALARQLQSDDEPSGPLPDWAALKGTDKLTFWRTVAQVGAAHGMRFPLVFLESCESGMATWSQWSAIPARVERIAHSGADNIFPVSIDYAPLLRSDRPDWIESLESGLKSYGVYVGRPWTLLFWVLLTMLAEIPWPLYFVPFALWLVWSAVLALARLRSAPTSRRLAA